VYENMVASYWNLAVGLGGYAIEVQGANLVWAGRDIAQFNLAMIAPGERPSAAILTTAADFFGTLSGPWFLVLPSNAAAPPSFEAHHVERGMVCDRPTVSIHNPEPEVRGVRAAGAGAPGPDTRRELRAPPGRERASLGIRRAETPADLEIATLLTTEAFGLPPDALQPARKLSSTPWRPWDRPGETYLLEVNGETVATASLNFFAGEAGIYGVATKSRYRGRGLARRIVSHAHATALSYGYPRTVLQAVPGAERVYEKAGFKTVEIFTHFRPV
jgi:GNAT superfamily N-acetyltransferase